VVAVLAVLALGLTGCGSDGDAGDSTITVLAASSLTGALETIAADFEEVNDGADVRLSFGASSTLVEQANAGAPADIVVTADRATFAALDGVGEPTIVARNRLTIVVEPGNPKRISALDDLARGDVVFVLCAPEVPCGRLGARALDLAGVSATPASLEENVKGVVSKVALGEADAGIAYVTDAAAAADDTDAVDLDVDVAADRELEAVYPMGVLDRSEHRSRAAAFVRFVAGPGQATLSTLGFLAP
jgi:molybdate transport system substrate-binding protein